MSIQTVVFAWVGVLVAPMWLSSCTAQISESGAGSDGGRTRGAPDARVATADSGTMQPPIDSSVVQPPPVDSGAESPVDAGTENPVDVDAGSGGTVTPPSQVPAGWQLALNDNFDGSTLGPNWGVGTNLESFTVNGTEYWAPYIGAESEYLTASMVAVQDSSLIMSTMASASPISGTRGTKSFISGYVTTYGRFEFQYGYVEIRAKLPEATPGSQTGLWPALWMLNSTYANADEIDLLESFGGDQLSFQTNIHPSGGNAGSQDVDITPGYHVFGILHEAQSISLYVDNQLIRTFNVAMSSNMAILMGLQLGNASMGWISGPVPSNWGGGIHGANTADLIVDWVHVWTQ